jgi:hypothetical protein
MASVGFNLVIGEEYTPEQLAERFGFKPYYLRTAGGMVTVTAYNALLLITHAQRDASFQYGDYWDGDQLIYTGRGQKGDQKIETANLDVAENRRQLFVFEHVGTYRRRYLGRARCVSHAWERGPDKTGVGRQVLKFRLSFNEALPRSAAPEIAHDGPRKPRTRAERRPRPFDEMRAPTPPTSNGRVADPAEVLQLFEKANQAHHQLLVQLKKRLLRDGWHGIEEIPAAVDLWASRNDARVIFEAKTISVDQELPQTRAALSQLLEYRFFYGRAEDLLCLVANRPISVPRQQFLNALGVQVIYFDGAAFQVCGELSHFSA